MKDWKKRNYIERREYALKEIKKIKCEYKVHPLYNDIYKRIYEKNSNMNILITGISGTGKSYVACKLADMFDNHFDIEQQVFTSGEKYIEYISELLKVFQDKDGNFSRKKFMKYRQYFRGRVLWLDEGVLVGNTRDFWTQSQRNMQELWNIFRFLGMITIVCVPSMNQFFKDGLEMMHMNIHVLGNDKRKLTNQCKVFSDFKYNKKGKMMRRYFWAKDKQGLAKKITRMNIKRTRNTTLLEEYELLSAELKFNAMSKMIKTTNRTDSDPEQAIVKNMQTMGKSQREIASLTGFSHYKVRKLLGDINA